jgi:hypothetical protein
MTEAISQWLTRNLNPAVDLSIKHILSSLARDWLRIISGLLIVEDPEPALRSPNKLMCVCVCVNGAERRSMRRTNPLTKQRSKPQVSTVFGSVSILIDAECTSPRLDEGLPCTFFYHGRISRLK